MPSGTSSRLAPKDWIFSRSLRLTLQSPMWNVERWSAREWWRHSMGTRRGAFRWMGRPACSLSGGGGGEVLTRGRADYNWASATHNSHGELGRRVCIAVAPFTPKRKARASLRDGRGCMPTESKEVGAGSRLLTLTCCSNIFRRDLPGQTFLIKFRWPKGSLFNMSAL